MLESQCDDDNGTTRGGASRVMTFGDTFAIFWPTSSRESIVWVRELQEFSAATAYVIALAFISGLQLRGAFAIGEYYLESDIAIGPAVADAAEWYEQSQLIGVMATPETRRIISAALSHSPRATNKQTGSLGEAIDDILYDLTRLFWPDFVLALKDGSSSQQLCLNWPYVMLILGPWITECTGEHVSQFFRRKLASRSRPASAEPKYQNTEIFFRNCFSYIDAAERRSFHLQIVRGFNTDRSISWLSAFVNRYK